MKKCKLTTSVRVSTVKVIRELSNSQRGVGRFIDELVERALREGWLQAPEAKEMNR